MEPQTESNQHHHEDLLDEDIYRSIVETAEEGIWIINTERKITFVNARLAKMLGFSVEEILGRDLFRSWSYENGTGPGSGSRSP
jgi:two-component system, NtrC family, sensor kinase